MLRKDAVGVELLEAGLCDMDPANHTMPFGPDLRFNPEMGRDQRPGGDVMIRSVFFESQMNQTVDRWGVPMHGAIR